MRVKNSKDYINTPFEISPLDLAVIFDDLNVGFRRQMQITNDIWEEHKWVIPSKYRKSNKKKQFIEDVLYQVDYLYHGIDINNSLEVICKDVSDSGLVIDSSKLIEDYDGISKFFKTIWIQLNYISINGYVRTKVRTLLKNYHYKKRTEKFCSYVNECLYFYKLQPTSHGEECDISTVAIDNMITFKLLPRRKRRS